MLDVELGRVCVVELSMSGRLEKPIYQLPMPLDGIDEVLDANERERSENALAALAALRVREPIYADNGEKLQEVGSRDAEPRWMELYRRLREAGWAWRVAVYIAWAAQPKKYRWPETQEELATRCLGLNSDRAIATWRKKNPKYNQAVNGFGIWDNKMYGPFSGIVGTFDYQGKEAVTANNGATGLMLAQGMIQAP